MRIALIYPPPWKIPAPGEPAADPREGPPSDYQAGDLDADFFQIPYGLLSLAAQAIRAGHSVKVFNLSSFAWSNVETIIRKLDADLFGLSCWTANRRGVALVAEAIKKYHPAAHVIVGGPHITPLGKEMLEHYPAIDTASVGESELTFLELLGRLEKGQDPTGIAGTFYRKNGRVEQAPARENIRNLDTLASPHGYFNTHILMTSRGCPWACTFCGAESSWGRGFRGQSVEYVLDAMEQALSRLPVKLVQIKDDTFTTNKKRVLELCRGIRQRKLNFLWSCDTRVDVLSEELLYEMRLAGCQRLSLGVESGSPRILQNIHKRITTDEIVEATGFAKKYGIGVRYYMMLGNRGETRDTFRETLDFLARARPNQYIFSCLSIYPGTDDFQDAERAGWLKREAYFEGTFQELKVPFDASEQDTQFLNEWFQSNKGIQEYHRDGIAECSAILERLGDHHAAHMDLGGAYFSEGNWDAATKHVQRALELDYPVPGLAYNYLACIAYAQGHLEKMQEYFLQAAKQDPQHGVLIQNVQATRLWFKQNGLGRGVPLKLLGQHDFQLLERTLQPTLPGPLSETYDVWQTPSAAPQTDEAIAKILGTDELVNGHVAETQAALVVDRQRQPIGFRTKHLKVL